MKFHILIYGCQMNYADSARISTMLKNLGFQQTSKIQDTDIVIFDTCSVRQKSEDKITGKLTQIPSDKKIWITGCMVQHNLSKKKLEQMGELGKKWASKIKKGNFLGNISDIEVEEIPFIINEVYSPLWQTLSKKFPNLELMFRIDDVHLLPKILKYLNYNIDNEEIKKLENYVDLLPSVANQTEDERINTAYVPISTGCNQFCSYCIVPFARGFEQYRKVEDIINEVKYWTDKGKEEIVLLGQIVNKHPKFYEILKEILKNPKVKWLRYTSPYPTYYSDEIFTLHEQEEKLCPHIHIPVQSGSNKILKLMNRGYTVEQFKEFIDKIRKLKRPISITTDIIVGFSQETEKDFQQTLDLVKYARFDMIYTGVYSPRPNTKAFKTLKDDIPRKEKQARWEKINNLLYQISLENNKQEIGKQKQAIIVGKKEDKYYGYTDNFKNIELDFFDEKYLGKIINLKIKDAIALKLFA